MDIAATVGLIRQAVVLVQTVRLVATVVLVKEVMVVVLASVRKMGGLVKWFMEPADKVILETLMHQALVPMVRKVMAETLMLLVLVLIVRKAVTSNKAVSAAGIMLKKSARAISNASAETGISVKAGKTAGKAQWAGVTSKKIFVRKKHSWASALALAHLHLITIKYVAWK